MNERQNNSPSLEVTLYAALFVTALALRLYHLGAQPLNDQEAREALTALARLRGEATASMPASPAYFFVTLLGFYLMGASEAVARLGPALAGAGLVLAPGLFRGAVGRGAALVMAGLLALASTLLAASRSADGALLALLGLAVGVGGLWRYAHEGGRSWLLGAAGLALGLASGGTFLLGALALVITLVALALTRPASLAVAREAFDPRQPLVRQLLLTVGVITLLIVTVFALNPRGLGALVASWTAWLGGFVPGPANRPAGLLPLFLAAYDPLILVFGLVGVWRAARQGRTLLLGLAWFSLAAFVLALIYPGRALADLVWVAAPMAALAGWALYDLAAGAWSRNEWPLVAAQTAIGFALLMFALLNVASYAQVTQGGRVPPNMAQVSVLGRLVTIPAEAQLGVAGLALALVLIVAYLFAMGWSERAGKLGLVLTGVAVLLPATLAAGWGVTQARASNPAELWWQKPAAADVWRLMETLGGVSRSAVGNTTDIEVTVQASDNGALRWLLRDFPNAEFVDRLGPQMVSPVVITPIDEENPTLGSSYVGQDFDLNAAWPGPATFSDWLNWVAYRRATTLQAEPVILWVRQDVQQLTSTGD